VPFHTTPFFPSPNLNQLAKLLIICNTHEYHDITWLQEECARKWQEIYCAKELCKRMKENM
jgi:hypothetical protein